VRKLIVGLLIFMAGWGLSWYTYNYSSSDQLQSAQPIIPAPIKSIDSDQSATGFTSTASSYVGDIVSLLQHYEFEAAVERYESLQVQLGDEVAAEARAQILSHVRQLIAESRFGLAEQLLQRFLVAAYRDVEARILLAEVYLGEQDFHAAIDQLYEVRGYAYRPVMLQRISNRIRSMVTELASSLKHNNDQNALLTLYQHLTQLEPGYAPWFIGLAASQLALDDKEAARRSLLLISEDTDVGAQAQSMLSEITIALVEMHNTEPQASITGVVGIPLHRSGNHFIVDARSAHGRSMRLLIDTGASLTILTTDVLEQRGIGYQNTGRYGVFNTANGPVRAPIYKLDSLSVGDWQVNQLEVGVLDFSGGSNIDGLLGMNFLRHFQFFIDQNEALLRLSVN
jgi:clan AA aspartic protease (TIGR02281 family)